ncbi:hypothetical protein OG948_32960 [Embleya sp. NBC_00888]|uniref:hypothetical protein n=1 Tax=Embleya sp. NBC_00888 TaxID=2975960 RepID=UPI003867F5E4|nr:hypothetical protein OG948_32960 [Embleya sp. NBC_00888]
MPQNAQEATRERTSKPTAGNRTRRPGPLVGVEGLEAHDVSSALLRSIASPPRIFVGSAREPNARPDFATLMALAEAAGGEPYIRGGRSASETLTVIAMQTHRYESARLFLAAGRTVVEQRGVYTAAVEDAVARHPRDVEQAHQAARRFLATVAQWRPLPDLVLLTADEPRAIEERLRAHDQEKGLDPTQLRFKATLFELLAEDDPDRFRIFDRREIGDVPVGEAVRDWLSRALPTE